MVTKIIRIHKKVLVGIFLLSNIILIFYCFRLSLLCSTDWSKSTISKFNWKCFKKNISSNPQRLQLKQSTRLDLSILSKKIYRNFVRKIKLQLGICFNSAQASLRAKEQEKVGKSKSLIFFSFPEKLMNLLQFLIKNGKT